MVAWKSSLRGTGKHTLLISALGRQKKADVKFQASLNYIFSSRTNRGT